MSPNIRLLQNINPQHATLPPAPVRLMQISPGQTHPLDMVQQKWFWLIGQFSTLILLAVMAWYFERRQTTLEQQVLECQNQKVDMLINVIEQNTQALNSLPKTYSLR